MQWFKSKIIDNLRLILIMNLNR